MREKPSTQRYVDGQPLYEGPELDNRGRPRLPVPGRLSIKAVGFLGVLAALVAWAVYASIPDDDNPREILSACLPGDLPARDQLANCDRILAQHPEDPSVVVAASMGRAANLSMLHRWADAHDQLESLIRPADRLAGLDARIRLQLPNMIGLLQAMNGEYRQALAALETLTPGIADLEEFVYARGLAHLGLGETDKAVRELEALAGPDKDAVLAYAYLLQDRAIDAASALQRATQQDDAGPALFLLHNQTLKALGQDGGQVLTRASARQEMPEWIQAMLRARRKTELLSAAALAVDPDAAREERETADCEASYYLGQALRDLGQPEADQHLHRSLRYRARVCLEALLAGKALSGSDRNSLPVD